MKLETVVAQVLDIPEERVDDSLALDTCDEWTSLAQIALMSALESTYATNFDIMESIEMDLVGAIRGILTNKGIDANA